LFTPIERKRVANAVLKYQTKSVVQEGVIDMKLTLGAEEAMAFGNTQEFQRQRKLPSFEVVNILFA
jgi:hypothetical protein